MAGKKQSLESLRKEIDSIDDQIHDLLMRRTTVVEGVRDLKEGQRVKIRPSREAEILYRLVGRHKGSFPKRELSRIWRELIMATLTFEGPFTVAAATEGEDGYMDLARDQYGCYTDLKEFPSARRVVEAVRDGAATVGIVPIPERADPDPWWRHLVSENPDMPKVIARLPVAGQPNGRARDLEALVICQVAVEETGRDRSLVAFDADEEIGAAHLDGALKEAELPPEYIHVWHDQNRPEVWLHLIEVKGYLGPDDKRLASLADKVGVNVRRVMSLGGYAEPLTEEELKTE